MDTGTELEGGCLCGAVRYRVRSAPFAADYCHCTMCQKSSGAPVACWMDFKTEQLSWINGEPAEYASSENARRGFCKTCGSTLSYRDIRHPEYCTLAIASLDNPHSVAPTYHIHTDSQMTWLTITDDCERYAKGQTAAGQ